MAGIGEGRVGYNPCVACEVGRVTVCLLCAMLVDDRLIYKIRAGRGEGPIKGVMGRRDTATDPRAGTRGRGAHTGRPEGDNRSGQRLSPRGRAGRLHPAPVGVLGEPSVRGPVASFGAFRS